MFGDEDLLALSGIQHYAFCHRQWALIHLEQVWADNVLTAQGNVMHERAHDDALREKRGSVLVVRGLYVKSYELGLCGICDVVEFRKSEAGHPLSGEAGLWRAVPVEYKRGRCKSNNIDRVQLCAQAMCLEQMFADDIAEGFLYYGSTKTRERVLLDEDLRSETKALAKAMHAAYSCGITPAARYEKKCAACSLNEPCISNMPKKDTVAHYIDEMLKGAFVETPS